MRDVASNQETGPGAILFVAADSRECTGWTRHWDDAHQIDLPVHWAREGRWKGRKVIAIANGAGSDRAYQGAKSVSSVDSICSIGFCGALDRQLQIGDVVQVSEVRSPGVRSLGVRTLIRNGTKLPRQVVLESVDHIVSTAHEKRTLREAGASVVEMEAAGVARAAGELGIPFHCVRVVSDLADETFMNDFGAALLPDGTYSVARLVLGALPSPVKRFGELIRLGQRTAFASKNLGEFLANCSF